jgi:putative nucleotidyltransferase with HDIG domain
MTIPSRVEAAAILLSLSPRRPLLRHVSAVAEVAAFLAAGAARRGVSIDRRVVESAALLHDLDKALPPEDPLRQLGHGHAGARWLRDHGMGELANAVECHPVGRLSAPDYAGWAATATLEERIVAYADKRVAQRVAPIDRRFARWFRNHPDFAAPLELARERAGLLEQEVCAAAGVRPDEVRRLRWVPNALERSRGVASKSPDVDLP